MTPTCPQARRQPRPQIPLHTPLHTPAMALLAAAACAVTSLALMASPAWAKLPAPSDEAKAKAAEAAAKTAHGNKVADYKLCLSMNDVAARYHAAAKKAGKPASAAVDTPACADPGPFVPPVAASAPAPAAAGASAPAPAPAVANAATPAKK